MATSKFVAYYRVSTPRQGRSGLGLDAQKAAVKQYLDGGRWSLIGEFTEVETGKRDDRPQLAKALHLCKVTGATLVIAKLDRLLRNAGFLYRLRDAGVKFTCVDMPEANETVIGIMAVMAEDEARRISERTKAALAEVKKRGVKLGSPRGAEFLLRYLAKHGNRAAVAANTARADRFAQDIAPIISDIEAAGITSYEGIARELNAREIRNARGGTGSWTAATVSRLRRRLCPAQQAA